jgi:hypothetical protein
VIGSRTPGLNPLERRHPDRTAVRGASGNYCSFNDVFRKFIFFPNGLQEASGSSPGLSLLLATAAHISRNFTFFSVSAAGTSGPLSRPPIYSVSKHLFCGKHDFFLRGRPLGNQVRPFSLREAHEWTRGSRVPRSACRQRSARHSAIKRREARPLQAAPAAVPQLHQPAFRSHEVSAWPGNPPARDTG